MREDSDERVKRSVEFGELERAVRLAQDDIRRLRHDNELLHARVETFELCAMMVGARPPEQRSMGMGEDPVWLLDRVLNAAANAREAQTAQSDS